MRGSAEMNKFQTTSFYLFILINPFLLHYSAVLIKYDYFFVSNQTEVIFMKNSKLFRKFFISYLFILLLPLITGIISYHVFINFAESSSIKNSLSVLNQSKMILDQKLTEVSNFARQLAMNSDVIQLLNQNQLDENSRVFRSSIVSQNLLSYASTNEYLQDTYLYIKHDQTVITPKSVFYRLNNFYELNHYRHLSFGEWKKNILEMNQQGKVVSLESLTNGKHNVIAYVDSLPLNSYDKPLGTVVVQIDGKKVNSLLNGIIKAYGGWAFVTDKDGQVLANIGIDNAQITDLDILKNLKGIKRTRYLNNKTLLISVRSNVNGWYYFAGVPEKSLMKNANVIKQVSWIVTLITLMIGLLTSLWFALRNSSPIHSLVMSLKEHLDPSSGMNLKDDYNFLQGNISNLLSKNKFLQNELNHKLPMLKEMVIYRLIHGDFNSSSEIEVAMNQTGLKIQNSGFVGILRIHGYGEMNSPEIYNELNVVHLLIKKKLDQMDLEVHVSNSHSGQLNLLFTMDHQPEQGMMRKMEGQLQKFCDSIEKDYHITFTIALGSYFKSLTDASLSFNHASQVMDYMMLMNNRGIFWYEQMALQTNMYEYTIDQELRLMNAMKIGEPSQAKQILEQVFEQNFNQKILTIDMVHQIINEIRSTFLKTFANHLKEDAGIKQLKKQVNNIQLADGLEQVRQVLEQAIDEYCSLVIKQKSDLDNEIVGTILAYFDECYEDPDLSVYKVAERVGRPEKFVSQLFKSQTGTCLMEYLEKIRMNKASELLSNTDHTIEAVSYQVGYNSPHSFRRAFKRVLNVTPNQYRKAVQDTAMGMAKEAGIR